MTPEEEEAAAEEEKKPSELELLLANSKFACAGLKDGYYSDPSVQCSKFVRSLFFSKNKWSN